MSYLRNVRQLILSSGICFATFSHVCAETTPLETGYWMIEVRSEMPGFIRPPAHRIEHICIREKDIRDGMIAVASYRGCTQIPGIWEGRTLNLTFSCPVSYARETGKLDAKGKTFLSSVFFESLPTEEGTTPLRVSYLHSGQWLQTDCPGN